MEKCLAGTLLLQLPCWSMATLASLAGGRVPKIMAVLLICGASFEMKNAADQSPDAGCKNSLLHLQGHIWLL